MNRKTKVRKSLGTRGVETGRNSTITGYVVIPDDVERDSYIAYYHRTGIVMVRDEHGSVWRRVFVSDELIQDIVLPKDSKSRGSEVVCVKIPKHNVPVVVGVLKLKNDYKIISEENQFRFLKRDDNGTSIDIDGKASQGTLDISIGSTQEGKGKFSISVTNPDKTAELDVYVKGKANLFADNQVTISSNEEVKILVQTTDGDPLGVLKYTIEQGFILEDEFGNLVTMAENSVYLKESDGLAIEVTDSKINLGTIGGSDQWLLKGDITKTELEKLSARVDLIYTALAQGQTAFNDGGATYKSTINIILQTAVDESWNNILSNKVKTD